MIFLIEASFVLWGTDWIIKTMQIKFSHKEFKGNIFKQNYLGEH